MWIPSFNCIIRELCTLPTIECYESIRYILRMSNLISVIFQWQYFCKTLHVIFSHNSIKLKIQTLLPPGSVTNTYSFLSGDSGFLSHNLCHSRDRLCACHWPPSICQSKPPLSKLIIFQIIIQAFSLPLDK